MLRLPAFLVIVCLSAYADTASDALRVLRANCVACHNPQVMLSKLDLTARDRALSGGTRGPSLILGNASGSLLYQFAAHEKQPSMPPGKKISNDDLAVLKRWIEEKAPYPAGDTPAAIPSWWSFRKPKRPDVPKPGGAWVRTPLDAFILTAMRARGFEPTPEAGRATLARRVYLDLHGLAPSWEQVREFVDDAAPDAYEKLVDKLLASPRYGEKWGRHWLDLVRYSDSAGFELDSYIHDAWRYRDYVIQSFNEDKPYDRFIKEQLAGDEYFPEDPIANTGTGYFCVGPNRDGFPDQADINRVETLTDFVDTTGAVFLGLTIGCARCHDHKYDPIPQKDYYKLQAVFAPAVKTRVSLSRLDSIHWDGRENLREIKFYEMSDEIAFIQARCSKDNKKPDAIRACLNAEELERLAAIEKRLLSMVAAYKPKPFACGVTDVGDYSPKTLLSSRGGAPEEIRPGFLSALGGGEIPERSFERPVTGPIPLPATTGRRHALAGWIASADNPLTARVIVNRVFHYHFGQGIVGTPSNFGTRGKLPTHPELLDWLATEFVDRGWSLKALHKLMVTSSAYRQGSTPAAQAREKDPDNLWLSWYKRRRLSAEELRDSTLQNAGALNLKMYGRPVTVPLSREETFSMIGKPENMWIVTSDPAEHTRRSVYLQQRRTFRLPMMEVFDTPESMTTCAGRDVSTTAPQSLTLLNGKFLRTQAAQLAGKLVAKHADDAGLAEAAWQQILTRTPTADERTKAVAFLATQQKQAGGREAAATELIRGLFNLNEYLYVD